MRGKGFDEDALRFSRCYVVACGSSAGDRFPGAPAPRCLFRSGSGDVDLISVGGDSLRASPFNAVVHAAEQRPEKERRKEEDRRRHDEASFPHANSLFADARSPRTYSSFLSIDS